MTFDPDASDAICAPAGGAIRCDLGTIAAGDSQSFVVAGQLSPSFDGARLVNTATATSPTAPDPATAADDTTVTRAATLRLEKTADSLTPSVGTEFEYNLSVTNTGPSTATGATVSDTLPDSFTVVSISATVGTCTNSGVPAKLTCDLGTLAVGASAVVTVRVRVPDGSRPGPVTNAATAGADDSEQVASAVTVNVVVVADTSVTKTLLTDPVVAGRPVTYRITAGNAGPATAPDVVLSDALPAGTRLLSSTTTAGAGCTTGSEGTMVLVECMLGALAVGAQASATVTLATGASMRGTLSNTVLVGSGGLDAETQDNTDTARGTLGAPPSSPPPSSPPPSSPPPSSPPSTSPSSTSPPSAPPPTSAPPTAASSRTATSPPVTSGSAAPAGANGGGGSLAGTGANVAAGLAAGLLAIVVGAGVAWGAARRRGTHRG